MNTPFAIRPVLGLLCIVAVSGMSHAAEPVAKDAPSQYRIEEARSQTAVAVDAARNPPPARPHRHPVPAHPLPSPGFEADVRRGTQD